MHGTTKKMCTAFIKLMSSRMTSNHMRMQIPFHIFFKKNCMLTPLRTLPIRV